jgi:hypothetical protein
LHWFIGRHFIKRFVITGSVVFVVLLVFASSSMGQVSADGYVTLTDASGTITTPQGIHTISKIRYFQGGGFQFYFLNSGPPTTDPILMTFSGIVPGKTVYVHDSLTPVIGIYGWMTAVDKQNGMVGVTAQWTVNLVPYSVSFTYSRHRAQLKLGSVPGSDTAIGAFLSPLTPPKLAFSRSIWLDGIYSDTLSWYPGCIPSDEYVVTDLLGKKVFDTVNVYAYELFGDSYRGDTLQRCPAVPSSGSYLARFYLHSDSIYYLPDSGISFHFILTGPSFLLVDQAGDTVRNTSFIIYRASRIRGNDVLITTATTDDEGKIPIDTSKYHYGDTLRFEHFVMNVPSIEHGAGGTSAYDIQFDNLRFDTVGIVLFDTVSHDSIQVIHIGHAFITLNPVVSIQWAAEQDFVDKTEEDFRKLANYLYDVYDGQVQLNYVQIYDNSQDWTKADVRYYATTEQIPMNLDGYLRLPRTWTGHDPGPDSRWILANYDWLTNLDIISVNFRTVGHEMGHYYFKFKDEYKGPSVRHFELGILGSTNLGYMQRQYLGNGPFCSELSSSARYQQLQPLVPNVYKTMQWSYNLMSCWDQFAPSINNVILANTKIHCYILRPDERPLQTDYIYLPGPNDEDYYPGADYDVGSLVHFTTIAGGGSKSVRYHFILPSAGTSHVAAAKVELQSSVSHPSIFEGITDNEGHFLLIGASPGDKVRACAYDRTSAPTRWAILDSQLVVQSAFSKSERIASQDSGIEVTMKEANGSYSFLPLCSWQSNGDLDLGLANAVPFMTVPTVTFSKPGSADTSEMMTFDNTLLSYTNRQSSPPLSSSVIVNATDSSGRPLPIFLDYSVADSTQLPESSNGKVQVILDSLNNKTIQRFASVSSDYPCPMNGLPGDAENMGSIHAISFFPPDVALQGNNELSITYGDTAFSHSQGEMQIFKWDNILRKWAQLGGSVDSTPGFQSVSVAIQSDGVYGVFATSVVSGVTSNISTNNNGLVAFYDAKTKTIRVNFEAASDERASLGIYNILGESVKSLPEQSFASGLQQLSVPAQELPSGVYFCMLKSQAGIKTAKIVIAH